MEISVNDEEKKEKKKVRDFFSFKFQKKTMEEGLSAGVCARSDGRLLSEAQPATCNATKQVHTGLRNEKKEKERRRRTCVCVCERPPLPKRR